MTLGDFIARARRLVALTGAGCSTAIRDPWSAARAEVRSAGRGARTANMNAAHRALEALEARGGLDFLITQNVDDLHQEAGSTRVVQLHGRNRVVVCLDCRSAFSRVDDADALLVAGSSLTAWSGFRFVKRAAESRRHPEPRRRRRISRRTT